MTVLDKYKDEISKKKYNPLSKKETNRLAMEYKSIDDEEIKNKIVNSHLRLAFKAVNKKTSCMKQMCVDDVMELINIANEAILESLISYTHDKIDFSYFCYVNCANVVLSYMRNNSLIKPTRFGKELTYGSYHYIDKERDKVEEDAEFYQLEDDSEEPQEDIKEFIIDALMKLKNVKDYKKEIFIYYLNFGKSPRPVEEVAAKFNLTKQRVYQIFREIISKIQNSKESMETFRDIYGI